MSITESWYAIKICSTIIVPAIRMVYGLRIFDHISALQRKLRNRSVSDSVGSSWAAAVDLEIMKQAAHC